MIQLNGWLTTGPNVREFESILSEYTGAKNVVALNHCAEKIFHLALKVNDFSKSDKFIVPTYTFVATAEVGEYLDMHPIFVDCDNDFNLDLDQVQISFKTEKNVKAIMPVHFAGKPVDMERLKFIAEKYNLFIIEDAAHAQRPILTQVRLGRAIIQLPFFFMQTKILLLLVREGP